MREGLVGYVRQFLAQRWLIMERAKAEQPSRKAWLLHHRMIQDTDKECLLVGIARVVGFLGGKTRPARITSMRTARYPCWRKSRWVAA